jgi:anti-sigma factor RsiW
MSCPWSEKLVSYVAGALDSREMAAVDLHLLGCEECRETASAQQAVWSALDDWSPAAAPMDFDRRLYARIAVESQRPWWHFSYRPWVSAFGFRAGAPVAAACVALVAAAFFYRPAGTIPVNGPTPATIERKVDVEQMERTLDDLDMLKQMSVTVQADDTESQS